MANHLATQQSPYLLQHKDNPVEWFPWGTDAFEKARVEDRPIFLSVGYSTCHWCHVMEHESFENPQVADVLNRYFVSIKVDREERPDVDRVYMAFVQATTGSGGWPMSVWLTPGLEPFYGGTYFPPTSRWGRPGFVEILEEIARVWREERDKVTHSASTIVDRLRQAGRSADIRGGATPIPGVEALTAAVRQFGTSFDRARGGFGDAPKFPRPSELLFLLREHSRSGEPATLDMVCLTLRAMASGGMRDHIGGGFHRYAVDADWRVPHFEKMLYDQAQLTLTYLEAAQLTRDPFYADVAADTLEYVRRDMTSPEGAFYSAEDADSVPPEHAGRADAHKMEGAFYTWRNDEIGTALGEDADVFRLRFGVLPDGNAPSDPQGEFTQKNLLYTARSAAEISSMIGAPAENVEASLRSARARLMRVRALRPRPHLDDKVLTAWNGLMIAAFARAARTQADRSVEWVEAAGRAADFLRSRLWRADDGVLLRRYRAGEAAIEGYAEDYAFLVWGLLELFQVDGNVDWLEWALTLQRRQNELFWDPIDGGWFSTTGADPTVLLRLKEDYDGAEPAASSVSVLNLLTLSHLTDDAQYAEYIERTLSQFALRLSGLGRAVPMMLAALSTYHAGTTQIVIVGPRAREDTLTLHEIVRGHYLPMAVTVPVDPESQPRLAETLPWISSLSPHEGRATAYVCRDFSCQTPATQPRDFADQLAGLALTGRRTGVATE
jgi:uncharacterized protein YyaL (SSP411 family)